MPLDTLLRRSRLLLLGVVSGLLPAVASAHPSLYFDAGDLPALQARAADGSVNALGYDFASAFQALQDRADQYRSEPCTYTVAIPNANGVGSETWSYTVSPAMPPAHPNNPSYPPWTGLSREVQKRLETMAFVYAITGDEGYLTNADGHGALDLALDVAAWSQWTDPGYSCGGQSCLDTAHLTLGSALVYDVGFAAMSDGQRTQLRDALVQLGITPLAADVTAANQGGGAAAWFNGYALRVTGLAVGAAAVAEDAGAQAAPWLTLASDSTAQFFAGQGSDGGTYEGQLYGAYAVDQLVIAAHALALNGVGQNLFDDPWLRSLPRFVAAFLGSNNRQLANFGDSNQAAYWSPTMLALAAQGDATAQWVLTLTGLAKPSAPLTFVWARPDLAPAPLEGSGSSLFYDVGHAALRAGFAGAPVVAVKSGPPTTAVGHNHFDHNSFMVSAFGEWIATDPGYRSYFDAPKRVYTTNSVGHNTILVDKWVSAAGDGVTGGQIETAGGTLEYLFDGAGYAKVVANAAATYEPGLLSRFGRRVLYAKPDLVLVFDDVAAPQAHEYSFLLHGSATSTLEAADGPAEMLITGLTARLQAFVVSSAPLGDGYPVAQSHPGAETYGPYAEWRTTPTADTRFAAALVPGRISHTELANPGFEQDLTGWQPRSQDGSHSVDTVETHSGSKSARIENATSGTGYFYSEPLTVLPGAAITAGVFARAQGTGTLSIQPYWMHEGAYIDEPAGEPTSIDATTAGSWTSLERTTAVPATGVDAVRIALQFSGTGTVWFDDASFETSPRDEPTPLARAVVLGEPPAGLIVEGPFGVEAAASLVGASSTGTVTLEPATQDISAVPSLSSDGALFAVGLDPAGELKRAYLQGGTFIAVGEAQVVGASDLASFDVAVIRDDTDCPTLFATQVVTLEAPPYRVRAAPEQIMLDGERVPFEVEADEVVFPMGADLGPGCPYGGPGPDAGAAGGEPSPGAAPGGEDSGCGCRTGRGASPRLPIGLLALAASLLGAARRGQERGTLARRQAPRAAGARPMSWPRAALAVVAASLCLAACGESEEPRPETPDWGEEGWSPSSETVPSYYLQPDGAFRVHPSHPRLYFRRADVEWLQSRAAGPLAEVWGELEWMASSMAEEDPAGDTATSNVKGWYGTKGQAIALMALLTDDATYRQWAIDWAKAIGALEMPTEDTPLRARLERLAVVYDWLHDSMSEADRTEIRSALVRYVEVLRDWGYIEDPGYIGGHERWGYAVFAMGLIALHGEYADADALLAQCRQHLAHGFYPAQSWIAEDGGYHMGWAYTQSYSNFDLPYFVWTVGTNDVLLDDWLAETHYWYLYGLRGDDLFPQTGDAFSIGASLGTINSIYAWGLGKRGHARWYLENKVEPTSEGLLQLLLADPEVPATPADELPKGRLFERAGLVVARDRWDADTTHLAFKSGAFFSINHHHRDENTFTLHYRAPLAIDSGYYDSYGSPHWRNYFTRTIAHNGMVIFDPAQEMTLYGDAVSNDGGQLFRQEARTAEDIQPGGHASLDGILRFEDRDELTYAWGDATKAYDADRVSLAQREVVYLRDLSRPHPAVVVFDRVSSTDPGLDKRFVLHTVEQPSLDGMLVAAEHGGGRLTSATVYPPSAQLSLIGGADQEFVVDGQNYPLDPQGAEGDPADKGIFPGAWRLEVAPGQPSTEDFFLHVLFVDDAGAAAVAATDALLIEDSDALGVQLADWIVVFPRASEGVSALDYPVAADGPLRHLVVGLPPGQSLSYGIDGASQGTVQIGDGGCAVFELDASAGQTVALK